MSVWGRGGHILLISEIELNDKINFKWEISISCVLIKLFRLCDWKTSTYQNHILIPNTRIAAGQHIIQIIMTHVYSYTIQLNNQMPVTHQNLKL